MVLLVVGTKESALFNTIITIVHVVLVVFIIVAGGSFLGCCFLGYRCSC